MLSHWPIRTKLSLGLGLLAMTVLALFGSALYGLYAYRELVRSLAARSEELPLASQVQQSVSDLRVTLSQAKERLVFPYTFELEPDAEPIAKSKKPSLAAAEESLDARLLGGQFNGKVGQLVDDVKRYSQQLESNQVDAASRLADDAPERSTLAQIEHIVDKIQRKPLETILDEKWPNDNKQIDHLLDDVTQLQHLAASLPGHLHERLHKLSTEMKARYRVAIIGAWMNVALAVVLLGASRRVFYKWFAEPLQLLVAASRQVAGGDFEHRIQLDAHDEMGVLADALNAMTDRFREVRDDLDRQVRDRTNEVVRSEQLASVGFLAAGVSHEINNPLASIALCSESLEGRLQDLLENADARCAEDVQVARNYLQMIQREAFRCKQITEKLLDFARRGDAQRQNTDLRDLVEGVIDMVQHLGQYHDKKIDLVPGSPVIAAVNSQELKQVVLNLVTNGLESLEAGGTVRVAVQRFATAAQIIIEDNGCGMTDEVRRHLFEPFFTRRRTGQGTGLGLSISHRIVEEHRGRIEAHSDGPGRGSRFTVTLPAVTPAENTPTKENYHRRQAA